MNRPRSVSIRRSRLARLGAAAVVAAAVVAVGGGVVPASASPAPLAVITTYLSPGAAQTGYKAQLAAIGGQKPYSWSIASGVLPTGLTLNATTGAISGRPSFTGTSNVVAQVTDSEATPVSATQAESITVTAPTLAITTTTVPDATYGVAYSQKLAATGGVPSYAWTLTAGALPAGLTLKPNGTITGKATTSGTSSFTVEVADSDNPSETATEDLSVTVDIAALTVTTTSLPDAVQNEHSYTAPLTATGGVGKYTWQVIGGQLPPALSLLPTGAFTVHGLTGITGSGTYQFQVQVTDSETPAQSATQTLQIYVEGGLPI